MSRIDCENTMTVCAVKKLKGHTGRTFLGILHTARGAEAAFAAEGNKFHVVASGADIHGTAKRRIATIQHFIDIFHLRISGMKSVFDYFIIVIKDFLQDIHNVIMREREEKRKPHPSRLRGRGVEVSKTLFCIGISWNAENGMKHGSVIIHQVTGAVTGCPGK